MEAYASNASSRGGLSARRCRSGGAAAAQEPRHAAPEVGRTDQRRPGGHGRQRLHDSASTARNGACRWATSRCIDFAAERPEPARRASVETAAAARTCSCCERRASSQGKLYDVGGTHPLRITFTSGGQHRDLTSDQVAASTWHRPAARRAVTTVGLASRPRRPAGGTRTSTWPRTGVDADRASSVRKGQMRSVLVLRARCG